MKEIIKLEKASKTYLLGETTVEALKDASLTINKGEAVIVLGPSGSGKSTMMHIIGCLDLPTKGKVFLDGKDISKLSESELSNLRGKKIGFIFQTFNLIPHLTTRENVALPMELQDVGGDVAKRIATELLNLVDLKNRINHYPNQLSGGERQRVAIARALANDPEVILADEPTGNLDSKSGEKIMNILEKLHKKGKTIIIVTHDRSLTVYGQKIVHLKDGMIKKVQKKSLKAPRKNKKQ